MQVLIKRDQPLYECDCKQHDDVQLTYTQRLWIAMRALKDRWTDRRYQPYYPPAKQAKLKKNTYKKVNVIA